MNPDANRIGPSLPQGSSGSRAHSPPIPPTAGRVPGGHPLSAAAGSQRGIDYLIHGAKLGAQIIARLQPGTYLLSLAGHQLAARSDARLSPGEKLLTQVDRSGPAIVLKIVNPTVSGPRSGDSQLSIDNARSQVINQALRAMLPRQQPMALLLNQLSELPVDKLAGPLAQAVRRLLTAPSDPKQLLQPPRLIQALANSGVLLETKLSRPGNAEINNDFKAMLLRTLAAVSVNHSNPAGDNRPQQPLREIVENALARIETQQLATLRDDSGRRVLTSDLLLRDADRTTAVEIAIDRSPPANDGKPTINPEEQAAHSEAATHRWKVTLNFDLPGMGKLESVINLHAAKVSIDFRTELAQTRSRLTAHLDRLDQRLNSAGIIDSELTAGRLSPGSIQDSAVAASAHPLGHLIDLTG